MFARRARRLAAGAAVASICLSAWGALAVGRVTPAHGSTRAALVHAFTVQDGASQGISGIYVSGSNGVVCKRTPDAGLVRFLFQHTGHSWHYVFSTRGLQGTAKQRRLERACG